MVISLVDLNLIYFKFDRDKLDRDKVGGQKFGRDKFDTN
jgi:hypothetical protein